MSFFKTGDSTVISVSETEAELKAKVATESDKEIEEKTTEKKEDSIEENK